METPLHFLLIDDNPNDRALTERELKRAFPGLRLTPIITQAALEPALAAGDYDFVITDYHINWTDGMKVLAAVKLHLPHCPVIMFTGTGSEHIVAEAMKNELDDYVVKTPAHFARLPGAVRNALERTAERAATRIAETRYRSLFEHLPLGLYRITPDGHILEANAALAMIAGCPDRASLFAHNADEFFVSKDKYRDWQALLEANDTVVDFEGPGRKLDGRAMWVRNNVRVVRDTQGAALYYEGSLEEITEQVQAAQQMRKLSSAIEQTADSVMITNRDGVIEYVNPAFELITGYASAEALGRKPSLMKSGQHDDAFYRDLWGRGLARRVVPGCIHQPPQRREPVLRGKNHHAFARHPRRDHALCVHRQGHQRTYPRRGIGARQRGTLAYHYRYRARMHQTARPGRATDRHERRRPRHDPGG